MSVNPSKFRYKSQSFGQKDCDLFNQWNDTEREYPSESCAYQIFEKKVVENPSKIAIEFDGHTITYQDLNHRANQLGCLLQQSGASAGSIVGLCLDRSIDMVAAMLAVQKIGAAYVPMDPFYPKSRISYVLADSEAKMLITQRSLDDILPKSLCEKIYIDDPIQDFSEQTFHQGSSEDLAYIIYTSGSTGKPKGVEISNRALLNFLLSMQRKPGLCQEDVLLAVTTLSFDISGLEIFLPLITGATISLASRETAMNAESLIKKIEQSHVTFLQATPVTWRMLLASNWKGETKLKALIGGEAVPKDLVDKLQGKCESIWNMYGPTETTIWSTTCKLEPDLEEISIGEPIDNTQILIVDSNMNLQPVGTIGEILIGGDGLAKGYRNLPELTTEKFVIPEFDIAEGKRFYRTGDLGRWRSNGQLECLGRIDNQVKIRGFRIELGEIENVLSTLVGVRQVVVDAKDFGQDDKELVAYFLMHNEAALDVNLARKTLQKHLPDYMFPKYFLEVESIPMTPNGKVDRTALMMPESSNTEPIYEYVAPSGNAEVTIAKMFEKILKIEAVGAYSDFFDLGGNSFSAVRLMTEIEKIFDIKLPLANLFMHSDVRGLASLVRKDSSTKNRWSCLVALSHLGKADPIFLVHGAGGNLLIYRELVKNLAPQFPVFGFQSIGLDQKTEPLKTVTEMATYYVEELLNFRPSGPYNLGGYCMGGIVVLEMARQLKAQGKKVGLVALFDSYNFSVVEKSGKMGKSFSFILQKTKFHLSNMIRLKPKNMMPYFKEKSRLLFEGSSDLLAKFKKALFVKNTDLQTNINIINELNHVAGWNHIPRSYSGDVVLYRPKNNYYLFGEKNMGWDDVIIGKIENIIVSDNPHSMLTEPDVSELGKSLKKRLTD